MTRYTLTAIDTTQIQSYVFGSNQLKENIGGSELVELATHQWVYEALPTTHNVANFKTEELDTGKTIDLVDAEIVYAGGGNTVVLFKSILLAQTFTRQLTRRILTSAPGLEIVVTHREFDWETTPLAQVVQQTLGVDLARKKQTRQPSVPLLGLGVTIPCNSTGLVASGADGGKPISRETKAKIADGNQQSGERRLLDLLPRITQGGWNIPRDFDKLGRIKGDEGYIAVVHADGNGMGKRIEQIAEQYGTSQQNRAYIDAMREFSGAIKQASRQALRAATDLMANALIEDAELAKIHHEDFPMRPIVFGGDDMTFVCNGRYGLPLAVRYLQAFEKETAKEPAFNKRPVYACAGVAIVKVHYPFARAYHLSEQLCLSAKKMSKEMSAKGGQDCSALDWHFAMAGITGSLQNIRENEYEIDLRQKERSKLHMRPVLLHEHDHTWRSWPAFQALTQEFAEEDGGWYDRRNKVKALREALRAGPIAVEEFLRTYRLPDEGLPQVRTIRVAGYQRTGWDRTTNQCIYFDPIEAMDFYTNLEATVKIGEGEP